jgi:hypothetical protein
MLYHGGREAAAKPWTLGSSTITAVPNFDVFSVSAHISVLC